MHENLNSALSNFGDITLCSFLHIELLEKKSSVTSAWHFLLYECLFGSKVLRLNIYEEISVEFESKFLG
jgi:hypothetical protein